MCIIFDVSGLVDCPGNGSIREFYEGYVKSSQYFLKKIKDLKKQNSDYLNVLNKRSDSLDRRW